MRPTPEKMLETVINKMFEIAGHDVKYEDISGRKDQWFLEYTMTVAQNEEWKKWMKKYLMKECKMYAKIAERNAAFMSMNWGLKFSDPENL